MSELSLEDLMQARKVIEFKGRIGPLGLYQEFSADSDLTVLVQKLITNVIDRDTEESATSGHQYSLHTRPEEHQAPVLSKVFFTDILNQLEEELTNGARTRLTLADVWVDPELRRISSSGPAEQATNQSFDMSSLVDGLENGTSFVVFGAETSGKSCLCRTLFVRLRDNGYFPVLLRGNKINNPDPRRFMQRVRVAYAEQYENVSASASDALPKDKIILLVDDFDRARLMPKRALTLLGSILTQFCAVLVSSSPVFALNILRTASEATTLLELERVEIRDIGHHNRYVLIERWCVAGVQETLDEEHLRGSVERKRRVVDQVLGTNLVPRTPLIVLILLQAIEAKQVGDLARSGYVRYYKFLIDSAILRSASPEDAEFTYALLPELAWAMYRKKSDTLEAREAERVIEDIAAKRALRKTALYRVLAGLRRMSIFEEHSSSYRFKHPYVYYFFLADYISGHLDDPIMTLEVQSLCHQVTENHSRNVLIFLSFYSNSEIIINEIIKGLSLCFPVATPFEFDQQSSSPVNRLIYDLPKLAVDHSSFAKNRHERLKAADRYQSIPQNRHSKDQSDETDKQNSELLITLTSIEVLGHILRNHYARLDASPKLDMLNSAAGAALRCLGSVFSYLSQSLESVVAIIRPLTDKIDAENDETKREEAAKQVAFYAVLIFALVIFRKLVRSVGDEALEITYQDAMKDAPRVVTGFVKLAIKLDYFRDFPIDELKEVSYALRNDRLGTMLLRILIRERLDMTPPRNRRDLQRICDAAGLDLKPLLLARQS